MTFTLEFEAQQSVPACLYFKVPSIPHCYLLASVTLVTKYDGRFSSVLTEKDSSLQSLRCFQNVVLMQVAVLVSCKNCRIFYIALQHVLAWDTFWDMLQWQCKILPFEYLRECRNKLNIKPRNRRFYCFPKLKESNNAISFLALRVSAMSMRAREEL